MAVQTVDLANIDTVIKDGVNVREIVLDGVTIWSAPFPAVDNVDRSYEEQAQFYSSNATGNQISGDGLVIAQYGIFNNVRSINVYSRPDLNSAFQLQDTITLPSDSGVELLQLSQDGSVIMYQEVSRTVRIFTDDGSGSYSSVSAFANVSEYLCSLSSDGSAVAYFRGGSTLYVDINIGTKAAPNWFNVLETSIYGATGVDISERTANGLTVTAVRPTTSGVQIYRFVMDSSLTWTGPLIRLLTEATGSRDVVISDDGRTIVTLSRQSNLTYVHILRSDTPTSSLITKRLLSGVDTSGPTWRYNDIIISGDGNTVGVRSQEYVAYLFYYGKQDPFDSETSVDVSSMQLSTFPIYVPALTYDGSMFVRRNLYETIPAYSLSTTNSVNLINEGQSFNVRLQTTNVTSGTAVAYTITGVEAADLVESLTGSFTIIDNQADLVFNAVEDLTTEGTQTATLSIDDDPSVTIEFSILDTSTTP